jgi:hypothetical protein
MAARQGAVRPRNAKQRPAGVPHPTPALPKPHLCQATLSPWVPLPPSLPATSPIAQVHPSLLSITSLSPGQLWLLFVQHELKGPYPKPHPDLSSRSGITQDRGQRCPRGADRLGPLQ